MELDFKELCSTAFNYLTALGKYEIVSKCTNENDPPEAIKGDYQYYLDRRELWGKADDEILDMREYFELYAHIHELMLLVTLLQKHPKYGLSLEFTYTVNNILLEEVETLSKKLYL